MAGESWATYHDEISADEEQARPQPSLSIIFAAYTLRGRNVANGQIRSVEYRREEGVITVIRRVLLLEIKQRQAQLPPSKESSLRASKRKERFKGATGEEHDFGLSNASDREFAVLISIQKQQTSFFPLFTWEGGRKTRVLRVGRQASKQTNRRGTTRSGLR